MHINKPQRDPETQDLIQIWAWALHVYNTNREERWGQVKEESVWPVILRSYIPDPLSHLGQAMEFPRDWLAWLLFWFSIAHKHQCGVFSCDKHQSTIKTFEKEVLSEESKDRRAHRLSTMCLPDWPSLSTGIITLAGLKEREVLMTNQKGSHTDIKQAEKREVERVSVDLQIHHHHLHPWTISLPSKQAEKKGRWSSTFLNLIWLLQHFPPLPWRRWGCSGQSRRGEGVLWRLIGQ